MNFRRHHLLYTLPLVALGFIGLRSTKPSHTSATPPSEIAFPQAILREMGVFEPRVIQRIRSPIAGHLADNIEDGASVRSGDLLFRIDDEEVLSNIEGQEESLGLKREELGDMQSQLAVLIDTYAFVRRMQEAERAHAALNLDLRTRGLQAEERRQMEIDIELAQLDLEDRQDRLHRQEDLVAKAFAPASSLEILRRESEAAATFLDEKKTQYSLSIAPLPDEERLTLEAALTQATDVVERSLRRHEREKAAQELKIEGISLEITHIGEGLAKLREQSALARFHAPTNGVFRLTRRFSWSARTWQTLSPGQRIWASDTLGELVDPDDLALKVMIHESDRRKIFPGQTARVRINAFPDQERIGRVVSISALGQDRSDLSPIYRQSPPSGQALFLAEIEVNTRGIPARPGMTATVDLERSPAEENPQ